MKKRTFAIALVYADGVPFDILTGLTALDAAAELACEEEKYEGHITPHVFCYDADDEEAGHYDHDRLIEYVEDHCKTCGHKFENEMDECDGSCTACHVLGWPDYANAMAMEDNGPDFTAEELRGL